MVKQASPNEKVDVVVVGAGIAGLTAGVHLAERGLSTVILEADEQSGGGRVAGQSLETRKRND